MRSGSFILQMIGIDVFFAWHSGLERRDIVDPVEQTGFRSTTSLATSALSIPGRPGSFCRPESLPKGTALFWLALMKSTRLDYEIRAWLCVE